MKRNFTQIDNKLIRDSNVSNSLFRTYTLLKSYQYTDAPVFPSQSTLASILKTHRSTINRHIKKLRQLGFITSKRRGFSSSNLYNFICTEVDTNDNYNRDINDTSKDTKMLYVMLGKSHINNTKFNNTKSNNNIDQDNFSANQKKIDEIRAKHSFLRKNG